MTFDDVGNRPAKVNNIELATNRKSVLKQRANLRPMNHKVSDAQPWPVFSDELKALHTMLLRCDEGLFFCNCALSFSDGSERFGLCNLLVGARFQAPSSAREHDGVGRNETGCDSRDNSRKDSCVEGNPSPCAAKPVHTDDPVNGFMVVFSIFTVAGILFWLSWR